MEQLNEKIEGLVKKAEKSGMPYSILKKVYDRGMAAWKTGHRPGTTPQQWAFARVNSFVTKSSGTWGKADKDLADKVRGAKKESIENPKKAKDLIGQVREKLGKDADAGDYVKDFRKSKAPQFKGKSDKKIQKMAIAAYLDSKEEVVKEETCPICHQDPCVCESLKLDEAVIAGKDYKYDGKGPIKISKKMYAKVQRDSKTMVKGKPYMMALNPKTQGTELVPVKFEEVDMQEEKGFKVDFGVGREKGMAVYRSKKDAEAFAKRQKRLGNKVKITPGNYKQFDEPREEKEIQEALKINYVLVDTSKNNEVIAMSNDEQGVKDSMRTATLPPLKVKNKSSLKIVKLKRPKGDNMAGKLIGEPLKSWGEETDIQESGHQDVPSMKTQVQIAMDALQKMNTELGKLSDEDELPTWWTNKVATAVNKLDGMADYIDAMHDRGQKMNEEHEAILSELTEKFTKVSPQVIDKIKGMMKDPKQKESLKNIMTHLMPKEVVKMLHKEIPATKSLSEEEVDNSLMAQATRVISDTSIKEKIDPADIDMKATAADRKAADKNIIIQLRRAQDMVKQTGRQDQTGIEFLDKKKQKIDSKIINKALDMFDKMKPNDKAKMQKTIGKSYRDLLKTVQRGRV